MNCREFRRKHDAYVDDTLSGVELDGMANHRRTCERCAQLDTRIRRALLVAHNLPTIQPSAAFSERLQARLRVERLSLDLVRENDGAFMTRRWYPLSASAFTVLAAGVLAAAGLAMTVSLSDSHDDVIHLAPVIASRPESEPSVLMPPTMVAAMPAGMPLWPAVFVAQQAPWHFASDAAGR
ncbi:MAG: hypothetical protein JWL61_2428 [Gemmatimonadetes bacterium]|jgi:hypothetical protein|nr:hypothetical protein [Gemmatimonadota bacterium]